MSRTRAARRMELCLEGLESRFAPAKLVSASQLVYQDRDGDTVTVAFSKPILNFGDPNAIFTFESGGAVNGSVAAPEQLRRIDLASIPAAAIGVGITVTATRSPVHGGDGFAAVGEILASGIDLGAVKIDGDLGRILAGDGTASTPGLVALTTQSLGRYGTSTGAVNLQTTIQGRLGALTVRGDVKDAYVEVAGGPDADIGNMLVGGSVIGGSAANTGTITAEGDMVRGVIRGDLVGGTGNTSGEIGVSGTIGSLTVRGNVIGGSASGTASLYLSGFVYGYHIRSITIGGSLIAGTDTTSGQFFGNGAVLAIFELGAITIKGNIIGNPTSPAVISAGGQFSATGATDLAIGSVVVAGRVEHGLIEAGVDPINGLVYAPIDADAQIGSVVVGGDWIASSIAAGVVAGAAGFGNGDVKMAGPDVKDDPSMTSKIGKVAIAGQVLGTMGGTDFYGFVAESVGTVKIGGVAMPLSIGIGGENLGLGISGDFSIHEV